MPEQQPGHEPVIGAKVLTIYGEREVMDVLQPPDFDRPMVFLRAVGGGRETAVALSEWHKVVRP